MQCETLHVLDHLEPSTRFHFGVMICCFVTQNSAQRFRVPVSGVADIESPTLTIQEMYLVASLCTWIVGMREFANCAESEQLDKVT